jgi:UDP-N-acetylglucosamine acyltransferase
MVLDMSSIHSRALIDPRAVLGEGCVVGPDAIIEGDVVLGPGCVIGPRACLTGKTTLGAGVKVGVGAIVGGEPQDLSYRGEASLTEVGEGTTIREYVTIHRGTKEGTVTRVGKHCFLMTGAHVAHNCQLGDHVILANNVLLAGHVEVGNRAFLGGGAVVHQHNRIGAYAMLRGQIGMSMDVPPYCMATKLNTIGAINQVGLRRNGFDVLRRRRILNAMNVIFRSGKNRSQALEAVRADESLFHADVELLLTFVETTKRGLCRWKETVEIDEDI